MKNYWCFNEEQLDKALAAEPILGSIGRDTIKYFLTSAAAHENGLLLNKPQHPETRNNGNSNRPKI